MNINKSILYKLFYIIAVAVFVAGFVTISFSMSEMKDVSAETISGDDNDEVDTLIKKMTEDKNIICVDNTQFYKLFCEGKL